jgi:hypothetical protein
VPNGGTARVLPSVLVTHRDAVDGQRPRLTSDDASVNDRPEADGKMLVDPPSRPPAELPRV